MVYIVTSLLLLIMSVTGFITPLHQRVLNVYMPLNLGLRNLTRSFADSLDFYTNVGVYRDKVAELEASCIVASETTTALTLLEEENDLLRTQLNVLSHAGNTRRQLLMPLTYAYVLGDPNDLSNTLVFITAGSSSGVRSGDLLVIGDMLIGIVRDVYTSFSRVELITSSNISLTAYDVSSKDKSSGIITSDLSGLLLFDKVLQKDALNVGDTIVTSGKDGIVIPGLVLGKVSSVTNDPVKPLKSAIVEPAYAKIHFTKAFVIRMPILR